MSLVAAATTITVLMLIASVVLGWVADVRRSGGAISARESQVAAERAARGARTSFYTSRDARAEAMRERIRRERRRRERARHAAGGGRQRATPEPDRPPAPAPESDEARHRATLELDPGPVTADGLRAAYRRLVAAYHPDRVAGLGAKLQQLAEEETKSINEAYAYFKARL
ncbi:MAG: J domain-containing protein [Bacteroidota bacterium]